MKQQIKIGILTFHRSINNGAFMQCYSLCRKIQESFPDDVVEVIDYNSPEIERNYSSSLRNYLFNGGGAISFFKRIIKLITNPLMLHRIKIKQRCFKECLPLLPLSKESFFDNNMQRLVDYINSTYDIIVVGSDAIWNFVIRGYPSIYLPDKSIKPLKLSYAASCYGMDFELFLKNQEKHVYESLSEFKYVGVRDCATERFVNFFNPGIKAFHNCDPTCLLDVDNLPIDIKLLKAKLKKRGFNFNKPTIGVMGNSKMLRMIRNFYGKRIQIASLFNYLKGADVQLYNISPFEWSFIFRYFKFTITTYFHGTYLSLKNKVPVICVDLGTEFGKKYKPKTLDLLERLGLEEWYFKTDYKTEGIRELKNCCDLFLKTDLSEFISDKIYKESKYFDSFREKIAQIKEDIKND